MNALAERRSHALLEGNVAILTGMGPGLGQELAFAFVREGAKISICCRRQSELDRVADEARRRGGDVVALVADVTDRDQCRHLVDATVGAFGRIDTLVNSAYNPGPFGLFEDADLDDWRDPLEVNLLGSLTMTQLVVPHMKAAGGGSVININSMIHRKPLPMQAAYGASKAALAGATKMLARELGAYKIRVNSVFLGWMWGPPVKTFVDVAAQGRGITQDEIIAEITANIALGEIPNDADCADAAVFLASDLARVITGASLDVNGGEYMP
jgi:NAD(P)-dependent dehydrogenase (short-subunit alcohol dehydrogenase family)